MTKKSFLFKLIIIMTLLSLSACSGSQLMKNSADNNANIPQATKVEGELVKLDGNQLVIQREDGKELRLKVSSQSVYWEGIDWLTSSKPVVGDRITAFGEMEKDGSSFEVERYYSNLVQLQGVVFYVCGETEAFMLDQPGQDYVILPLPQKTALLTESPEDPTSYKYFDLMPNFGEELLVIGKQIEEPFLVAVKMTRMD